VVPDSEGRALRHRVTRRSLGWFIIPSGIILAFNSVVFYLDLLYTFLFLKHTLSLT
jgi:hypothetical protein